VPVPLDHDEQGGIAARRGRHLQLASVRLQLVRLDLGAVKDHVRIVRLQVEPENARQLLDRLLAVQPRRLFEEAVDQDAGAGWLVGGLGIGHLDVGELGDSHFHVESEASRRIVGVLGHGVPSKPTPQPSGQKPPAPVAAVERATPLGALCRPLQRSAETTEAVDNFLLGHSVAVVYDPDLLDPVQSIAAELDPDLVGVCVQCVPDQLDQAGDRFRSAESLQVLLVEFDVEIHGG